MCTGYEFVSPNLDLLGIVLHSLFVLFHVREAASPCNALKDPTATWGTVLRLHQHLLLFASMLTFRDALFSDGMLSPLVTPILQ